MTNRFLTLTAAILCAGTTTVAQSSGTPGSAPAQPSSTPQAKTPEVGPLTLGDKAPELKVAKFVKGDPITGFEKGKPYVVEFWATWCGPCKTSIPHLTELQKEYKGKVTFVGVSVWEDDQAKVDPFVNKEMGDKMAYTVAMDDVPALPDGVKPGTRDAKAFAIKNGAMSKTWMTASGQEGIPAAFIVNGEGRIAWIGHPMEMEEPLSEVVAGTWDIERAKAEAAAEKKAGEEQAKKMAGVNKAIQEFRAAIAAKDYDKASKAAAPLLSDPSADEQALNFVAWTIVDPKGGVEKKDLDLAMKAAVKADTLTNHEDPAILDTLARVYALQGDYKKAVELETKAVSLTPPEQAEMKTEMEAALKEYQDKLGR